MRNRDENDKKAMNPGRRSLLKATGAGAMLGALGTGSLLNQSHAHTPAESISFDEEHDIVVCGSGCAGLTSALFSKWRGADVAIYEKAGQVGGTTIKAAFWYWVPNNAAMRREGIEDPKPDFLQYIARMTVPHRYDPTSPTYGLSEWQYKTAEAVYDSSAPAAEELHERGGLRYRHVGFVPDYYYELPENKAPRGRVLFPEGGADDMSDGGRDAIRQLTAKAREENIPIHTGHEVVDILRNADGEVVGIRVLDDLGESRNIRARRAVIFGTGGYTHSKELRSHFLNGPIFGGCAALSNQGDFVRLASRVGVQLRNMNYAWNCPVSVEKAVKKDGSMSGMFSVAGDSMIFVNKYGKRTVNEKLQYNELTQHLFELDGAKLEYPNLVMISVWDQRSQDHSASDLYGRLIVPPGSDDAHVIKGDTLEELAENIDARLKQYEANTGQIRLQEGFLENLKASISRFNGFARNGKDLDFGRGDREVELLFNGPVKEEPDRENPTMWPISDEGPYYAALLGPGTLDTKGGPKTDTEARVLDPDDNPIPGLYGVGNCVASASGRAYWAGGGTLGPMIGFAFRAANSAVQESVKNV